jgi:peptide/nickel transport system ATP-binding protein
MIRLHDAELPALARKRDAEQRRRIQLVFQNPADALNPKQTLAAAISRPARLLRGLGAREAQAEVLRLLDLVRLPARIADRYPAEVSGGERQRVGIARALAAEPDVIVCDEVTSALDVSVQAAVLQLLAELRQDLGLAMLFITHDLGVVATVADEVLVLENGLVCEQGSTGEVLEHPSQDYSRRLLDAAPSVSHALALWDEWDAEQATETPAAPADEPSART